MVLSNTCSYSPAYLLTSVLVPPMSKPIICSLLWSLPSHWVVIAYPTYLGKEDAVCPIMLLVASGYQLSYRKKVIGRVTKNGDSHVANATLGSEPRKPDVVATMRSPYLEDLPPWLSKFSKEVNAYGGWGRAQLGTLERWWERAENIVETPNGATRGGRGGVPSSWPGQDCLVAGEGGHRGQAPIGLHERQLHALLQALVESSLEIIDVPAPKLTHLAPTTAGFRVWVTSAATAMSPAVQICRFLLREDGQRLRSGLSP